jgi:hypothetical protein
MNSPEWVTVEFILEQLQQIMSARWEECKVPGNDHVADKRALEAIAYRLRMWQDNITWFM